MNAVEKNLTLFSAILDSGKGSEAINLANELGALGKILFIGRGIVSDELLNALGITTNKKELLFAVTEEAMEGKFFEQFTHEFNLDYPNQGIGFSMPVDYFYETDGPEYVSELFQKGEGNMGYEAIFTIVNKSAIDDVIDAAEEAGATGGTVFHGRGLGKKEKFRLFNFEIEPEKEMLMMLAPAEKIEYIVEHMKQKLDIEQHGRGIIFTMNVNKAVGLYNGD